MRGCRKQYIVMCLVLLLMSFCKNTPSTPDMPSTPSDPNTPPEPKPEVKILTTWKANYTLEQTPATGKISYYEAGTYNPESDTGTAVKLKVDEQEVWRVDLGKEAELGTLPEGQGKSFDVVVKADYGLRKLYRSVQMSGTTSYDDSKEGVLKLSGFNLDEFIDKWLYPGSINTQVINRWRQDRIDAEFNPDIEASKSTGGLLFRMSDFMPSEEETKMGISARETLDRGVRNVSGMLQGRKYVAVHDGDYAAIRWADFLKKKIGNIADIKYKGDSRSIEKLTNEGYEVLNLEAKRLPNNFINEIIGTLKRVKELSNGEIKYWGTPVREGNRIFADLLNIPDGASWSFYSSKDNIGNSVFPPFGVAPVDSHMMVYNSDVVRLAAVIHETKDAFFGADQDVNPSNIDDWIRFCFTRPAGGEANYRITKSYEARDGLPEGTNIIQGTSEYQDVTQNVPEVLNLVEPPRNAPIDRLKVRQDTDRKRDVKK